jgi:general secretion pathway protein A
LYKHYFNFNELPFSIAPDPHFMFMSERHQEGLAHLLYGINMGGGFVALTGEVGTGKTTLCRCLLEQLPDNIDIALILNPKLNDIELLSTLCDELGIVYDAQQQRLKYLIDVINQHLLNTYAKGRRTVLLIDEAQNLSLAVLEQIRLLTNLETSKTKLLQIILVGQPELKDLLQQQNLRQLNQRITARYHLLPLSFAETRAYIQHRLRVCQGNPHLFTERAIRKIFQFSAGVPRLINIICDRALLGAYANNVLLITPEIISHAAEESLGLGKRSVRLYGLSALLVMVSIVFALSYFLSQQPVALVVKAGSSLVSKPQEIANNLPMLSIAEMKQEPPKTLKTWLDNPALSLNAALFDTLKVWKKPLPADNQADCEMLKKLTLHCLIDTASWDELLKLNRPVILEFTMPAGEKRYALLVGMRQGQVLFHEAQDVNFSVAEVQQLWDGHFILAWQSPRPKMQDIIPNEQSGNVLWLRQQLSKVLRVATPSKQAQLFDEALKIQVIKFQQQQHLTADGVVGPRTLIHLDNRTGALNSPHLLMSQ